MGNKRKPASHMADFVTVMPIEECRELVGRSVKLYAPGPGGLLTSIQQKTIVRSNDQFVIERHFSGAIKPIRLEGQLDSTSDGGTHVHGKITTDVENQVVIEGMLLFIIFYALMGLVFLRSGVRGAVVMIPLFLFCLGLGWLRWRALRFFADDVSRWLRRKLYIIEGQRVRSYGAAEQSEERPEAQPTEQAQTRHGTASGGVSDAADH